MKTEVTIEGVLVPIEWEDDGRVRSLAINTFDDREMRLEGLRGVDSRLWSLLGRRIRVTGRIHTTEVLLIEEYKVVE